MRRGRFSKATWKPCRLWSPFSHQKDLKAEASTSHGNLAYIWLSRSVEQVFIHANVKILPSSKSDVYHTICTRTRRKDMLGTKTGRSPHLPGATEGNISWGTWKESERCSEAGAHKGRRLMLLGVTWSGPRGHDMDSCWSWVPATWGLLLPLPLDFVYVWKLPIIKHWGENTHTNLCLSLGVREEVRALSDHLSKEETDQQPAPANPGCHTYRRGHTAEVYQEKRYWQSAVSWLNSGIPSFTNGSQWKKMVEETDFVLSCPHLEDEVNTTSRSPSVRK